MEVASFPLKAISGITNRISSSRSLTSKHLIDIRFQSFEVDCIDCQKFQYFFDYIKKTIEFSIVEGNGNLPNPNS